MPEEKRCARSLRVFIRQGKKGRLGRSPAQYAPQKKRRKGIHGVPTRGGKRGKKVLSGASLTKEKKGEPGVTFRFYNKRRKKKITPRSWHDFNGRKKGGGKKKEKARISEANVNGRGKCRRRG